MAGSRGAPGHVPWGFGCSGWVGAVKDRIILHLCAKEGSDTKPYRDAGYDVRIIGEDIGVENYAPPQGVYGIIANPPCTMFSVARSKAKTPRDLTEGMRLVKECLRIIWQCQTKTNFNGEGGGTAPLKFWALENPASGFLKWFLGNPTFQYCQSEYGSLITKKMALWGYFNPPVRPILFSTLPAYSTIGHKGEKGPHDMQTRSRCPIDFAKAFYAANP